MLIKDYLQQPFNYFNDTNSKWIYVGSAVVFSLIFLIIFQPYGISTEMSNPENPGHHKFLFFLSIAVSTFLSLTLSQFFLRQLFGYQNVSNKKYLFWILFETLILLLVNFAMSFIVPDLGDDFEQELDVLFQLKMYPKVLLVLLFPIVGSIMYIAIKRMHTEIKELDDQLKAYKTKYETHNKKESIQFLDENNQPDITLLTDSILYIESSNQYVLFYYISGNQIKKHILRNRLKQVLVQLKGFSIKQCHRSFAVNLIHAKHVTRKNGKAFLSLSNTFYNVKVPVSKSFLEEINTELMA